MIPDPAGAECMEITSETDLVILEKLNCMCEYVMSRFELLDKRDELAASENLMKSITILSEGPGKCLELQQNITSYFESRI